MTVAKPEKRIRNGQVRWYARYRDPDGRQRARTFDNRKDAVDFLTTVEGAKLTGSYVRPELAKVTVQAWADRWLSGKVDLKPSTRARYEGIVRQHVTPRWGGIELAKVSHSDVQAWVADMSASGSSAATVRKTYRVLSMVLASAVKDGRLNRNPADGVSLPRVVPAERRYLAHAQVAALADACAAGTSKYARNGERAGNRLLVLFLAYTGLRFGEVAALRVRRIDFLRRRATVSESVTAVEGVGMVWGTPKGHEAREVPIPTFLLNELAAHVTGKEPDDLVFPGVRSGGPLRSAVFRRGAFGDAAAAIGVPDLHPHELRHTAASLAIASGADVKVVQQMLGHSSAAMTLDVYGHLFGDRLDVVADAMDAARTAALASTNGPGVYPTCTEAEVVALPLAAGAGQ